MRVIYTAEALADLDEIVAHIASHYPNIFDAFQHRLLTVVPLAQTQANWEKNETTSDEGILVRYFAPGVRIKITYSIS